MQIYCTTDFAVESMLDLDERARMLSREERVKSIHEQDPLKVMNNSDGTYAQYWNKDRSNTFRTRTYINDVDVSGSNLFSVKPSNIGAKPAQPPGKLEKVKQQLHDSAQAFNTIFEKAQGKFKSKCSAVKQAPTQVKHDPRVVYHDPRIVYHDVPHDAGFIYGPGLDFAVPTWSPVNPHLEHVSHLLDKGRDIGQKLQRQISRPFSRERQVQDMTPLHCQHPAVPDMEANLTSRQVMGIEAWASDIVLSEEDVLSAQDDAFRALTTSELLNLGGERIDTIEVVRQYVCPPNTPQLDATNPGPACDLQLTRLNLDVDDDTDFNETVKGKRKDLIHYLGDSSNVSLHLVAGSASSYDADLNLSDYYELQLVEPRLNKKVIVQEIQDPITRTSIDGDENSEVNRRSIDSMVLSENSDLFDAAENLLVSGPSYPPAQCLVLYLHGQGMTFWQIIEKLSLLDEDFIYNNKGKFYAGIRFPELNEWSDNWMQKVLQVCASKKPMKVQKWDALMSSGAEGKKHGLRHRLPKKIRRMKKFVEHTIENHFWWRLCLRERKHTELFPA